MNPYGLIDFRTIILSTILQCSNIEMEEIYHVC